ncbi:MAG: formate acetyltransferase, partial [Desulfobacterales bacterium CG23_combo_of_CG06-09_8_20_14_all_51_8]
MKPNSLSKLLTTSLVASRPDFTHRAMRRSKTWAYNSLSHALLQIMALLFNRRPSLNRYLKGADGWMNFKIGFRTRTDGICQTAVFSGGKMSVIRTIPENVDVTLWFSDEAALLDMLRSTPNEVLGLILKNRMTLDGNLACLQLFNYFVSLLMGKKHLKMMAKAHEADIVERKKNYGLHNPDFALNLSARAAYHMALPDPGHAPDPGVVHLTDPYLSEFNLDDFPRLKTFHDAYFSVKPAICAERAELLTHWFRKNGFETDETGNSWNPTLRQALAFQFLMKNKKPIIRANDLIAGTTTTHDTIGVIVYPDAQGTLIWGELGSIDRRFLNPYAISEETREKLHTDIFPFWKDRNFREWVRRGHDYPLCQRIEERWVAYFVWKSVGISHTIPDFKTL